MNYCDKLGQAQPVAGLVKLLLAAKVSLEVYWIDVQLPLIKKANFIFSRFDVIGHFHIFPV